MRADIRIGMLTLVTGLWPLMALGGDGVLEINQACADPTGLSAGGERGCFPGDEPGFPVTIDGTAGRSYRLTSDLTPPHIETTGIVIESDDVTIDMSGFGIIFPGNGCLSSSNCPQGAGDGIGPGSTGGRRVVVRNGLIANAGRDGIFLSDIALVEAVRVTRCGRNGIALDARSILTRSHVDNCGENGVSLGGNTVFSHSVFGFNNQRGVPGASDRTGGVSTVGNVCADGSCSGRALQRRFYLTRTQHTGDAADEPGVCAPGFHFAHFSEIAYPSVLRYDTTLGHTRDDSGQGVPSDLGWVRSGKDSDPDANCSLWMSRDVGDFGLHAAWDVDNLLAPGNVIPWSTGSTTCLGAPRVWCVED